jgi:hypothetical protein
LQDASSYRDRATLLEVLDGSLDMGRNIFAAGVAALDANKVLILDELRDESFEELRDRTEWHTRGKQSSEEVTRVHSGSIVVLGVPVSFHTLHVFVDLSVLEQFVLAGALEEVHGVFEDLRHRRDLLEVVLHALASCDTGR